MNAPMLFFIGIMLGCMYEIKKPVTAPPNGFWTAVTLIGFGVGTIGLYLVALFFFTL